MAYDVGKITRELQARFRLFEPGTSTPIDQRSEAIALEMDESGSGNLATPANLAALLAALRGFTNDVATQRKALEVSAADVLLSDGDDVAVWDQRMTQWLGRLGAYDDAVSKAPPGDRQDVLWSVTAPLLLGFFGGAASKLPQQPLDAVTPFMLANQLAVLDAWRDERWQLFLDDLEDGFSDVLKVGGGLVALLVPAAAVAAAVWAFRRRR